MIKQIFNNFQEYYFLTVDGKVYNGKTKNFLTADKKHRFRLKMIDGTYKDVYLKPLYKLVFGKNYCEDNIINLENEVWKEVTGTGGLYFISNMGRVKSLQGYNAIILKPDITNNIRGKTSYYRVDISYQEKQKHQLIHRLVASAFLEQPKDIANYEVHHKDFNSFNNKASNLVYLTIPEHNRVHQKERKKRKEEKQ